MAGSLQRGFKQIWIGAKPAAAAFSLQIILSVQPCPAQRQRHVRFSIATIERTSPEVRFVPIGNIPALA
jgi:hypothetical protein